MKKKEKQMGNITETGHFEKLIKEQEDECPHSVWQQKGEPEYREDGTPYLKWDKDIQCICDSTDELMQLEEELDQEALEWERKDSEEEDSNQEISKLKSLLIDLKKEIRNVQFYEDGDLTTDELLDGVVEKIELGLKEGK